MIKGLEGLSAPNAIVTLEDSYKLSSTGPILITHWGLSGPAVLKLSAWGARYMASVNHRFNIKVNWTGIGTHDTIEVIRQYKNMNPKKNVVGNPLFGIPRRLWERIAVHENITNINYADISNKKIETISALLTAMPFSVSGKSTFKDEFVTAGGVDLNDIDFKTMQSKKKSGLYFAGRYLILMRLPEGLIFRPHGQPHGLPVVQSEHPSM